MSSSKNNENHIFYRRPADCRSFLTLNIAIFEKELMKLLKSLFLLAVVSLPLCVSVYSTINTDEKCLEFVENLNEEEEGDDNEGKDFEESEFAKNYYVEKIQYFLTSKRSISEYAAHNELRYTIIIDVQTPPPEYTMS